MKSASSLMFVLFLVLKLTVVPGMGWFWVFFPLWVGYAFLFVVSFFFDVRITPRNRLL